MKTKIQILLAVFMALLAVCSAHAQGALTPPGAPAPTMKSLDQVQPRTPISSLPFTISSGGTYYLTANLTGTAGTNGITINASDVTVDLTGFSLTGVSGSQDGINATGSRITILNGSIHNWGTNGIYAFGDLNLVIRNLIVSSNGATGIYAGLHGQVESCIAEANFIDGIEVANGSSVLNCQANRNGQSGIYCYSTGTFPQGSIITGCTASQNSTGITASPNALISGNNLNFNSSIGVSCDAQGARIVNNNFANNYNAVYTPSLTNLVIQNSFIGSSNTAVYGYSTSLPIGPLINAAGMATNLNPNANFVY